MPATTKRALDSKKAVAKPTAKNRATQNSSTHNTVRGGASRASAAIAKSPRRETAVANVRQPRGAVSAVAAAPRASSSPQKSKSKTTVKKLTTSKATKTKAAPVSTKSKPGAAEITKTKTTPRVAKSHTAPLKSSSPAKSEVKARRVRAPKDLAVQYGEGVKKKRAPKALQTEKRARRDAAARARLKELMTPDDDLLARLARAGMIASSLAPEGADDDLARKPKSSKGAPRRSRKWDSRCGKCGGLSTFKSPAGICAKCGAIAVRVESF